VLPLLIGIGSDIQKTTIGRLEVELQARLDRALGRPQGGVVGVGISTKCELDVG